MASPTSDEMLNGVASTTQHAASVSNTLHGPMFIAVFNVQQAN